MNEIEDIKQYNANYQEEFSFLKDQQDEELLELRGKVIELENKLSSLNK